MTRNLFGKFAIPPDTKFDAFQNCDWLDPDEREGLSASFLTLLEYVRRLPAFDTPIDYSRVQKGFREIDQVLTQFPI